eukprot:364743-Chlamydomonas_euryale.AAC.112
MQGRDNPARAVREKRKSSCCKTAERVLGGGAVSRPVLSKTPSSSEEPCGSPGPSERSSMVGISSCRGRSGQGRWKATEPGKGCCKGRRGQWEGKGGERETGKGKRSRRHGGRPGRKDGELEREGEEGKETKTGNKKGQVRGRNPSPLPPLCRPPKSRMT